MLVMEVIICNCNQVSEKVIKDLIISGKAKHADDIEKQTGASDDCGRCRRNLEFLIKITKTENLAEVNNNNCDGNNTL